MQGLMFEIAPAGIYRWVYGCGVLLLFACPFLINTADLVIFGFRGSPGGTLPGFWPGRTSLGGLAIQNTNHSVLYPIVAPPVDTPKASPAGRTRSIGEDYWCATTSRRKHGPLSDLDLDLDLDMGSSKTRMGIVGTVLCCVVTGLCCVVL